MDVYFTDINDPKKKMFNNRDRGNEQYERVYRKTCIEDRTINIQKTTLRWLNLLQLDF